VLGLAPGLQTGETERMEGGAVVVGNKREAALVVRPSANPRSKHSAVAPPWETPRRGRGRAGCRGGCMLKL